MRAERAVQTALLALLALYFLIALVLPMAALALRSVTGAEGLSLEHYSRWLAEPRLLRAAVNSLVLGLATAALTTPLAFGYAYALERTRMPGKRLFAALGYTPILVPSLLPALALMILFGTQGLARPLLGDASIRGFHGLVLASALFTFPHALIVLRTALSAADGRLYEAGKVMGAGGGRMFFAVTLPQVRHGLVSAFLIVFMLTVADVGAPKVVGGDFDVLALAIYQQVVGLQNFALGGVIAMALLAVTLVALAIERWAAKAGSGAVDARAVPLVLAPHAGRDATASAFCGLIAAALATVILVCLAASLVRFWPYDFTLTFEHYRLDRSLAGGFAPLANSLLLAAATGLGGATLVFAGAYLLEKTPVAGAARGALSALALAPAAIPGLALGLAYVFFVSTPANPLGGLAGTMTLLVVATITHFYSVAHLTALAALRNLDSAFETAARVMGRPFWVLAARVSAPLSAPAIVDVGVYFFVNAMTTVSAVIFLYGPGTPLAAVAVLNLDDSGDLAPAAALAMLIFAVNLAVRIGGDALREALTPRTRLRSVA